MDPSGLTYDAIDNPWAALVAVVFLLGTPIGLLLNAYLTRRAGQSAKSAEAHAAGAHQEIVHQANPNSGASLKDSLNRIEAFMKTVDAKVDAVEAKVDSVDRKVDDNTARLDEQADWLEDVEDAIHRPPWRRGPSPARLRRERERERSRVTPTQSR
ncbi:hypothetical protein D3C74_257280 [compost metagenome]